MLIQQRVFEIFVNARERGQPIGSAHLVTYTNFSEECIWEVLRIFREKQWLDVVSQAKRGCGVLYRLKDELQVYPGDMRGRNPNSRRNLGLEDA